MRIKIVSVPFVSMIVALMLFSAPHASAYSSYMDSATGFTITFADNESFSVGTYWKIIKPSEIMEIIGQHLIGPHSEDINPGGTVTMAFSGINREATVGHSPHTDLYKLTYLGDGEYNFAGLHAPVPASLLLFTPGLIGLLSLKRHRIFKA